MRSAASSFTGQVEKRALVAAVQNAIVETLTPHQRRVLVALALHGVPNDVLAERLAGLRVARCTRPCTTPAASCAHS